MAHEGAPQRLVDDPLEVSLQLISTTAALTICWTRIFQIQSAAVVLGWVWVPEGQEPPALDIPSGFQVLPRCWVVERTLAWLGRNRQPSKDYEAVAETEEAFIYLGMIRLMLRRLAKAT